MHCGNLAYPEDLARVILRLVDAAGAHSPLSHAGVYPSVAKASTAAGRLADEGVDGHVAAVLLFDLLDALAPHVEENTPTHGSDGQYADDDTRDNATDVGACGLRSGIAGRGGCDSSFLRR